jgi:hypothetical protein
MDETTHQTTTVVWCVSASSDDPAPLSPRALGVMTGDMAVPIIGADTAVNFQAFGTSSGSVVILMTEPPGRTESPRLMIASISGSHSFVDLDDVQTRKTPHPVTIIAMEVLQVTDVAFDQIFLVAAERSGHL